MEYYIELGLALFIIFLLLKPHAECTFKHKK